MEDRELVLVDNESVVEEVIEEKLPIEVKDESSSTIESSPTIEGFEKELAIVDEVMKIRLDYLRNNRESIVNGAYSGKELDAVNSMLSGLSTEAINKVKLIKDSETQQAKANQEATMLAMVTALLTERNNNIQDYNNNRKQEEVKLEVKQLDNFDIKETELQIKE